MPAQAYTNAFSMVQAASMIVTAYKQLRAEDAVPGSSSAYRITVRQLEALVRISEALARLRARDVVAVEDVVEVHFFAPGLKLRAS